MLAYGQNQIRITYNWRSSSLSKLTPIKLNMELNWTRSPPIFSTMYMQCSPLLGLFGFRIVRLTVLRFDLNCIKNAERMRNKNCP